MVGGERAWQILRDTVNERDGTHPTVMYSRYFYI